MKVAFLTTDNRNEYKNYGAPAPYFGAAPTALLQGLAQVPEVEVHVVSCLRQKVASPPQLASNIFYHSLLVPRMGWMRTGYQGCIRAVRRKLKALQPDLAHGQGTELDCALSAAFSGFPNVLTIHGNMRLIARINRARPFSFLWLAARLEGFTLPRSDGVVCITEHTRQAVMGLARRTWVAPNAVDTSFFEINARPTPGAPAHLLCVAHIYALKNQNALIRALDPLAGKYPFELHFCGAADERIAYAREFLRLVRARRWCVHHGFAGRQEVQARLLEATALILPSLEDNCPMAILEAMAAGVPVIAARVGGVPELVEEGKTGFLCNPHEPASMAAAIERVLRDPAWAAAVARQARERARERFHPETIARRHLAIYREVLGRA
ncbi:MAG TPA: glycosyltransferase family 4 protein [Candidatus Paceibacterota bacterium]|nr:glycosyltransferase family 4 protein [Candidatus Paceibacterota bacterium]